MAKKKKMTIIIEAGGWTSSERATLAATLVAGSKPSVCLASSRSQVILNPPAIEILYATG